MKKKLHPVVLTVAIFQVLFGFTSMCCGGITGAGVVALFNDPKFDPSKNPPAATKPATGMPNSSNPPTMMGVQEEVTRRAPGYLYEQGAEATASVFLGFLMLVSGIGLFFMQSWARWLAICYAVLHILRNFCALGYTLFFVVPVMNEVANQLGPGNSQGAGLKIGAIIGALLGFSVVLYPLLVAILLLIPPVNRAFRGETSGDQGPEDYRDDFRDTIRREGVDDHYRQAPDDRFR
jgi:hypothetical protein